MTICCITYVTYHNAALHCIALHYMTALHYIAYCYIQNLYTRTDRLYYNASMQTRAHTHTRGLDVDGVEDEVEEASF